VGNSPKKEKGKGKKKKRGGREWRQGEARGSAGPGGDHRKGVEKGKKGGKKKKRKRDGGTPVDTRQRFVDYFARKKGKGGTEGGYEGLMVFRLVPLFKNSKERGRRGFFCATLEIG